MGTDIFKLVEGTPIFADYIKSPEEVDKDTLERIRSRYSQSDEIKLHRQMLNGENTDEYYEYNEYVEYCRAEGRSTKEENQQRLGQLTPHVIEDENGTRTIMVEDENI